MGRAEQLYAYAFAAGEQASPAPDVSKETEEDIAAAIKMEALAYDGLEKVIGHPRVTRQSIKATRQLIMEQHQKQSAKRGQAG
jgi:hypothetical protein